MNNKTTRYIFYLLAFLPILIFRDFTPDNELRYLSIADEALHNGSIFTFFNHGVVYADKPPLYLWIVMLGKSIFGVHSMFFLSLFSFLPALMVIYLMDKWVGNLLSDKERLIGELMLITCGYFTGTAIVLRMDMLMCMFIVLALYTFFRMYNGEGKPRDSWLFPIFIFMALFTKGPIGIIVPLVSTIVFLLMKKELKTIGHYWGWKTLAVLLTLCGAWFAGVYAEGGSTYLNNLLFNQTVNRAVNSFHHKEPFFYYFISIWYSLAPWSFLILGVLFMGLKKRIFTTDLERFFIGVSLSTFVVLSLFSAKLAVYLLPSFPFFVYLSLLWYKKLGSPRWMYILLGIPAALFSIALPGIIIASYWININDLNTNYMVLLATLVLSATGILTFMYLFKHYFNTGIIIMATGLLLAVFTVSLAMPQFNSMIGLHELCIQAKQRASIKGGVNYYYCKMTKADNLDVYLGKPLTMLKMSDLYQTNKIKKPAILFTWNKTIEQNDSIRVFMKDKKIYHTGKYYFIEIE
jgi:4-amino-4-deoxy-L-arabinose transferase-like glycosyltransferase